MMEELECETFNELYFLSKNTSCKVLEKSLIDAITTHETSFFRDKAPFELLKQKILPDIIHDRKKHNTVADSKPIPLNIWSAACSTGQELYSIAIIMKEILGNLEQYKIKLLGSDISEKALKKAVSGTYNDFEINRGLSAERMQRFFIKSHDEWKVTEDIREITRFRKINLIHPFHDLGKFDIIFCRNVALYFSKEDRKKFFRAMAKSMHPYSYLFIGSAESLNEFSDMFVSTQAMGATYYQLRAPN